MDPEQQKAYWNKRIVSWDSSIYGKERPLPLIERVAAPFRGNLRARREYAIDAIVRAAPRKILEIGCGTGEMFANLPAGMNVERYVGIDISSVAIEQARNRDVRQDMTCRPEYFASATRDLKPSDYGEFDFVLMLGLMPYITDDEFRIAARLLQGRSFLFDYHYAGLSVWNLLHWFYRRVAKHPFYRMHSDEGMSRLLRENGVETFELVHHRGVAIVQHFT